MWVYKSFHQKQQKGERERERERVEAALRLGSYGFSSLAFFWPETYWHKEPYTQLIAPQLTLALLIEKRFLSFYCFMIYIL